jgi:hypothetical protein
VTTRASGTFEVKTIPQQPHEGWDATIGRLLLDKRFSGDLEGTSKGQMLGTGSPASGSAGYVAMERVTGSLHGRGGTFALQHSGTMGGGEMRLDVTVVPGSGTGELEGISGSMKIIIDGGGHAYELDYELPSAG